MTPEEFQGLEELAPLFARAASQDDPIAEALGEWMKERRAEYEILDRYAELEREEDFKGEKAERFAREHVSPAHGRVNAAYARVASIVPTTSAGLAAQLAVAVNMQDTLNGARLGAADDLILVSMRDAAARLAQSA